MLKVGTLKNLPRDRAKRGAGLECLHYAEHERREWFSKSAVVHSNIKTRVRFPVGGGEISLILHEGFPPEAAG